MQHWLWLSVLAGLGLGCDAGAGDGPRDIIKAAIAAHGGKEKIASTLTGTLRAKGKFTFAPDVESAVTWDETFQLPRRYKRFISGQGNGENFSLEYAVTEGSGWIRQNGGEAKEFKGQKLPLDRSWNAMLAMLPAALDERAELKLAGKEKVGNQELVGVKIVADEESTLFFDSKSGLLAKATKRMQHPLTRKEVDGEVLYSDYKEVSGVQYPMRITSFSDGKKIAELEITRIKFLKRVEDRLFEKP
jgi:hypothetical protein